MNAHYCVPQDPRTLSTGGPQGKTSGKARQARALLNSSGSSESEEEIIITPHTSSHQVVLRPSLLTSSVSSTSTGQDQQLTAGQDQLQYSLIALQPVQEQQQCADQQPVLASVQALTESVPQPNITHHSAQLQLPQPPSGSFPLPPPQTVPLVPQPKGARKQRQTAPNLLPMAYK